VINAITAAISATTPSAGRLPVSAALNDSDEPIPLFQLRYGGSAHSFGFAIYSPPAAAKSVPCC